MSDKTTTNNNSGDYNTGDSNSGNFNSGNSNSGYRNTGNNNSGNLNSGDFNSGTCNTGDVNSGNHNSGNVNSGNRNSGNCNSGNCNSGNCNSGDFNSGLFNTDEPTVRMFNKSTDKRLSDIVIPSCLFFEVDATDSYKEAFTRRLNETSVDELIQVTELPNFDNDIFKEISGCDLLGLIEKKKGE